MSQEEDIFDVVDSSDSVMFTLERSKIHQLGLCHRAVHVLIFSNKKSPRKILLQKRSSAKDLFPNLYTTSCSGHVDSGETYQTAFVREMREETGLNVEFSQARFIGKIKPCRETGNEFTAVYEFVCAENSKFAYNLDEVAALEWLDEDEFVRKIETSPELFTPSFMKVYSFFKKAQPKPKA